MKLNFFPSFAVFHFLLLLMISNNQVLCLKDLNLLNHVDESDAKVSLFPALVEKGNLRRGKEEFDEDSLEKKASDTGDALVAEDEGDELGLLATTPRGHQEGPETRSLSSISSSMQQMLNLINNERRRNGMSDLCFNSKLILAARSHNNDMVVRDYFSHTGSDGSSISTRVNRVGYRDWRGIAENIAINSSVQGAHTSLMNSAGHRANILNSSYNQIGIGFLTQTRGRWQGYLYVTQVFGQSSTETCTGGTQTCRDSPYNWYDSDGPGYNCNWYASDSRYCSAYGSDYRNFGRTANEACCACGGGSS